MSGWEAENAAAMRRYRAAMSNGRGRQFEAMVEGGCRYYAMKGRAKIEKMPEPFRVMKKSPQGIATVRFTAKAQPDYIGCITGGAAIVFEAKYTDKDRLLQKAVTPTQAAALQEYQERGAIAAVCVGIGNEYFMVPWIVFQSMKARFGRLYIKAGDVRAYRVKFDGNIRFLEYVSEEMGSITGNL